jgi:hypothetical protein
VAELDVREGALPHPLFQRCHLLQSRPWKMNFFLVL